MARAGVGVRGVERGATQDALAAARATMATLGVASGGGGGGGGGGARGGYEEDIREEELRIDAADGNAYAKQDFIDEYGPHGGPAEWARSRPVPRYAPRPAPPPYAHVPPPPGPPSRGWGQDRGPSESRQARPVSGSGQSAAAAAATELRSIYAAYAPQKLPKVDSILRQYQGREEELLRKVRRKYL